MHTRHDLIDTAINRAVGAELRRARELKGWTPNELAAHLPGHVDAHTVIAHEEGGPALSIQLFIMWCRVLNAAAPTLLSDALQRARLNLPNLTLRVDLNQLRNNRNIRFLPVNSWAQEHLPAWPNGVAELRPAAVRDLAHTVNRSPDELADYLADFLPTLPAAG